jgi:hypothetical protein
MATRIDWRLDDVAALAAAAEPQGVGDEPADQRTHDAQHDVAEHTQPLVPPDQEPRDVPRDRAEWAEDGR